MIYCPKGMKPVGCVEPRNWVSLDMLAGACPEKTDVDLDASCPYMQSTLMRASTAGVCSLKP